MGGSLPFGDERRIYWSTSDLANLEHRTTVDSPFWTAIGSDSTVSRPPGPPVTTGEPKSRRVAEDPFKLEPTPEENNQALFEAPRVGAAEAVLELEGAVVRVVFFGRFLEKPLVAW